MNCIFCNSTLLSDVLCINHCHRPMFSHFHEVIYKITFMLPSHTVYVYLDNIISICDRDYQSFNIPYFHISPDSVESDLSKILKLKAFL